MSENRQRAALAERAARAGGAVAREAFRGRLDIETKDNKNDLVTNADYEAQAQVVHTIAQEFANEPFVCEESPPEQVAEPVAGGGPPTQQHGEFVDSVPDTGGCWVVDPIDGTANYARGNRTWGTVVAAMQDGESVAAATYLPALQDIYTAGPDSANRNGQTLAVSERSDPETFATALVAYWPPERASAVGTLTEAVRANFGDFRRLGCLQATLAFVASGELDAAVTTEPTTPWDTLAGVHLIRQAGGTVTGLDGERWTLDSEGLVASNGNDHETVVEVTRDAL